MSTPSDAIAAAEGVLVAVSEGDLTPSEGAQVMALIDSFRRTLEITELEERVSYSPTLGQISGMFKLLPAPADRFQCC